MITKQTIIRNKTGLHARPASDFVAKAKTFGCAVKVRNLDTGRPPVNAKSIIRLLGESMSQGTRIEVIAEGENEALAVDELISLIDSGFGE